MRAALFCLGIGVLIPDGKVEVFLMLFGDRSLERSFGRRSR